MRYTWSGWREGDECDPEEPGKEWLTIEEDGEEYAVIVLRTGASIFAEDTPALSRARTERQARANRIVDALNAYSDAEESAQEVG